MKRKRKLFVFVAIVAVFTIAWFWMEHAREPRYAGKSVSYWFRRYCRVYGMGDWDYDWQQQEALAAFKIMGTNAVPYLLEVALTTKENTTARKALYKLFEKFPRSWKLPGPEDWEYRAIDALGALDRLSPPADLILPKVINALNSTNSRLRSIALCAISDDGSEKAAQVLVREFADPDVRVRQLAIENVRALGNEGRAATAPSLIKLLERENPQSECWWEALQTLGEVGSNAAPVLASIKGPFLTETNLGRKGIMATALCQIDDRQVEALAYLTRGLKTETNDNLRDAIQLLGRVGPNARSAIPSLVETMDTTNWAVIASAARALKSIGASNNLFVPKLEQHLDLGVADARMNFSREILSIDPANKKAQLYMLGMVRYGDLFDPISVLVEAGEPAKGMLMVARQILVSRRGEFPPPDKRIERAIEHIDFMMKAEEAMEIAKAR